MNLNAIRLEFEQLSSFHSFPYLIILLLSVFCCSVQKSGRYELPLSLLACSCRFHTQVLYSLSLKMHWFVFACIIHLKLVYTFVLQCRFDISILVFVPWVILYSFFTFELLLNNHQSTCNTFVCLCQDVFFLSSYQKYISFCVFPGFRMPKFYVWDQLQLLFLCLLCHFLRQQVVSCFRWLHLAFQRQH